MREQESHLLQKACQRGQHSESLPAHLASWKASRRSSNQSFRNLGWNPPLKTLKQCTKNRQNHDTCDRAKCQEERTQNWASSWSSVPKREGMPAAVQDGRGCQACSAPQAHSHAGTSRNMHITLVPLTGGMWALQRLGSTLHHLHGTYLHPNPRHSGAQWAVPSLLSANILVIYLHLCCTRNFGGANKLGWYYTDTL